MTRSKSNRLKDMAGAVESIRSYMSRGSLSDPMALDAVLMKLILLGEAVKSLPAGMLTSEPSIRWRQIAGMRDLIAHHYFAVDPAAVQSVIDEDLPGFEQAIRRLQG